MELHKTDPEFMKRFEHFAFEEFVNENGFKLPEETRYLALLGAQGGCEPQLIAHAKGNMNLGNDNAFLICVVSQCLPYIGYPRSLNAIQRIEQSAEM